ncbi:glycosyltransferase family 2 protein [Aurantimicrobium minutum]|uniref:glycosyltransferase family 2 protein n=1 Tax=Aurantimicrobium minutum TaxID=708131 RepID=UPI002476E6E3|nr:glycosyltransferase family 2 protein [Aurantimicrobium minutum]MDH6536493.1 succinoglycan biosynthesis protein ExoA [Aurantimicrobium minutum]
MSALGSAPIPATPLPGVSYVMPVLNEVTHIRAAVSSLLEQDYAGPMEVTLALGPSTDGTNELVAQMCAEDPRIHSVDNPAAATPVGMNLAIMASSFPIVIRVDAHSVLPKDYASIAVETLLRTQADNVGGIMDAQGTTPFERAVARAYDTKVGLGGTPFHVGGKEGPVDTVYLGVFNRESLLKVGMFNEEIRRGQDWELNRRIRDAGGLVWFTPKLKVVYRPRTSVKALVKQMYSTGLWRGELSRRFGSGLRYFVPPMMVVATALGIFTGVLGFTLGWVVPAVYVAFVLVSTVVYGRGMGVKGFGWFPLVLPCIHFAWGVGFIMSYTRLTSNIAGKSGR